MNRKSRGALAMLGLLACLGMLTACQTQATNPEPTPAPTAVATQAAAKDQTLVVAQPSFEGVFSPFLARAAADQNAARLTQISMLTLDRSGGVVHRAIEGETIPFHNTAYPYTGPCDIAVQYDSSADVATYTIQLAKNLAFSDGEPVTADDILFSYYVVADPAYDGPASLASGGILGYESYRSQIPDAVFTKYADLAAAIRSAGPAHVWTAANTWTQGQQSAYWQLERDAWTGELRAIVDRAKTDYAAFVTDIGKTEADLAASDRLDVALGMYAWGFANPEGGALVGANTGTSWDLATAFPGMDDFYAEAYAAYAGDPEAFFAMEAVDPAGESIVSQARASFIRAQAKTDPAAAGGVRSIEGIQKIDPHTVSIQTKGYDPSAVYVICDLPIAPLHYYGDKAQYDYANNRFGHPFGDLSLVEAKSDQPMGAGPYRFLQYENGVCSYEANARYWKGEPKTKFLQLRETPDSELPADLTAGLVDIGRVEGGKERFEQIAHCNENGALIGNAIVTQKVDIPGFGYIGLNAKNIRVGNDSGSEKSRALRKAIATMLAVYRDAAYENYFGESASVLQYPISGATWTAPQPTDEGYRDAFCLDVNGEDIYRAGMTREQRYAAALQAAIGYLKSAGYLFDETTGKLVKAPEGAALSYDAVFFGNGAGEHPSFAALQGAASAFSKIGFELVLRDLNDPAAIDDLLSAGAQDIWCAEQKATIEPNFCENFFSADIAGKGGTGRNYFNVTDPTLDRMLLDARRSPDSAQRKELYRQILDRIVDWAVEVPAYQQQSGFVFAANRVDLNSLAPDGTLFWNWQQEIERIEKR